MSMAAVLLLRIHERVRTTQIPRIIKHRCSFTPKLGTREGYSVPAPCPIDQHATSVGSTPSCGQVSAQIGELPVLLRELGACQLFHRRLRSIALLPIAVMRRRRRALLPYTRRGRGGSFWS